jgi:hypothetical protein
MIDQAKQTANQVVEQVKDQASTRFAGQIGQTSETLHSTSEAIRSVGRELRNQQGPIAQFADQAADRVDRVSSYLRDKDMDQLVEDVERFARQNPATFIGGAFALGLIAARFLKSTPEQRRSMLDGVGGSEHHSQMPSWNRAQTTPSWNPSHETGSHGQSQESHVTSSPGSSSLSSSSTPGSSSPSSSVSQPSSSSALSSPSPGNMPTANPSRTGSLPGDDAGLRQSA